MITAKHIANVMCSQGVCEVSVERIHLGEDPHSGDAYMWVCSCRAGACNHIDRVCYEIGPDPDPGDGWYRYIPQWQVDFYSRGKSLTRSTPATRQALFQALSTLSSPRAGHLSPCEVFTLWTNVIEHLDGVW